MNSGTVTCGIVYYKQASTLLCARMRAPAEWNSAARSSVVCVQTYSSLKLRNVHEVISR